MGGRAKAFFLRIHPDASFSPSSSSSSSSSSCPPPRSPSRLFEQSPRTKNAFDTAFSDLGSTLECLSALTLPAGSLELARQLVDAGACVNAVGRCNVGAGVHVLDALVGPPHATSSTTFTPRHPPHATSSTTRTQCHPPHATSSTARTPCHTPHATSLGAGEHVLDAMVGWCKLTPG